MRRAIALALGAVTLAGSLSGCETTAEKSARLEKAAHHTRLIEHGLTITRRNPDVRVLDTVLVRGSEGDAAIVTLRNMSGQTLRSVPIAITVTDAHGGTLFQNDAPGLEAALTSIGSIPAHGAETWVNDQVPTSSSGTPTSVSAIAGVAPAGSGPEPQIQTAGIHVSEDAGSAGAAGIVKNRSNVTQQNLVIYVLGRRAGRIVAAGRAVLPEVPAGVSLPFQTFLVGTPSGAKLEASAPATTFG